MPCHVQFAALGPDARGILQGLVGELVAAARAGRQATQARHPAFPAPLAAALCAEAHLLASVTPDVRPPDMLGMHGVMRLATLADGRTRAERTAAA